MAFRINPWQAILKLVDLVKVAETATTTATAAGFYWCKLVATHNDKCTGKNNITDIRGEERS